MLALIHGSRIPLARHSMVRCPWRPVSAHGSRRSSIMVQTGAKVEHHPECIGICLFIRYYKWNYGERSVAVICRGIKLESQPKFVHLFRVLRHGYFRAEQCIICGTLRTNHLAWLTNEIHGSKRIMSMIGIEEFWYNHKGGGITASGLLGIVTFFFGVEYFVSLL